MAMEISIEMTEERYVNVIKFTDIMDPSLDVVKDINIYSRYTKPDMGETFQIISPFHVSVNCVAKNEQ